MLKELIHWDLEQEIDGLPDGLHLASHARRAYVIGGVDMSGSASCSHIIGFSHERLYIP
jgi:hypothetical protein